MRILIVSEDVPYAAMGGLPSMPSICCLGQCRTLVDFLGGRNFLLRSLDPKVSSAAASSAP